MDIPESAFSYHGTGNHPQECLDKGVTLGGQGGPDWGGQGGRIRGTRGGYARHSCTQQQDKNPTY